MAKPLLSSLLFYLFGQVLSADVNQGFQEIQNIQVYKVNGVKVHNLAHLARMVEECDTEFIRFDLEWKRVRVSRS